jgi:hypothetical protein
MKRFNRSLRRFQPNISGILLYILVFSLLLLHIRNSPALASLLTSNKLRTKLAGKLQLDSHLPAVNYNAHGNTNNVNAKFGSRFDFVISPGIDSVQSGTDGVYHDNSASLPASNACIQHTTPGGNAVSALSYDRSSDETNGTLFLAGNPSQWIVILK